MAEDEITFRGHPNILSLHSRTLEITKDDHLSPRGDCIIGVNANKACADLDEAVKNGVKRAGAVVKVEVVVGNELYSIQGLGDSRLSLTNKHDIVIRKTQFVCPRTLTVNCNRASIDLPRNMVLMLQDKGMKGLFRVSVE
ncbi:MAG TPA: DUF371 domain-containing protein [Nitrososphaera sp.]|nr:DUF371 domain-containing protein [Nitrososphaera sp.]